MSLIDDLVKAFPRAKLTILQGVVAAMPELQTKFHITPGLRLQHFVAQMGHESDGFHTMEEYASGRAYEGRKDLGNTQTGDGVRYKGRGPFMLTGRSNYRNYGKALGLDLENTPILAALPVNGTKIAAQYWSDHSLNKYADLDDIVTITKRINGGLNGLADRRAYLTKMKAIPL